MGTRSEPISLAVTHTGRPVMKRRLEFHKRMIPSRSA
jgi:hypothetical protein